VDLLGKGVPRLNWGNSATSNSAFELCSFISYAVSCSPYGPHALASDCTAVSTIFFLRLLESRRSRLSLIEILHFLRNVKHQCPFPVPCMARMVSYQVIE
jgi:hypothetical protein